MRNWSKENFKTLKNEMEVSTRRWKALAHIHIARGILWKWPPYQKQFSVNTIPIKLPMQFFAETWKITFSFIWKHKRPRLGKTILNNKSTSGSSTITDLRAFYKATVTKTIGYWHKRKHSYQWNRTEFANKSPHSHNPLVFDKEAETTHWGKDRLISTWYCSQWELR